MTMNQYCYIAFNFCILVNDVKQNFIKINSTKKLNENLRFNDDYELIYAVCFLNGSVRQKTKNKAVSNDV